ncbi:10791_t:CDS:1, partial [Racocetra persica]
VSHQLQFQEFIIMGKIYSKPSKHFRGKKDKALTKPDVKKDQLIQNYIPMRKYSASYVLPLDDDEVDRMTLQHYLFQNIWKSNFSSPVENMLERGAKMLDIG